MPISIHAPAKGATASPEKAQCAYTISIHAPAKGATVSTPDVSHCPRFQSTLPRRERPDCIGAGLIVTDFNPRSREGSDSVSGHWYRQSIHFNPRSREGSDPLVKHIRSQVEISIHAPAKGATQEISEIWLDT